MIKSKLFLLLFYNYYQALFREYKDKILFHDSAKAKTFGLIKFLPPGITITFDFREKARE